MENTMFHITADKLQAFIRYELPFDDLLPEEIPGEEDITDTIYDPYYVQWVDIRTLLQNLQSRNDTAEDFQKNWGEYVFSELLDEGCLSLYNEEEMDNAEFFCLDGEKLPANHAEAMYCVFLALVLSTGRAKEFQSCAHCRDFIDFERLNHDIQLLEEGRYSETRMLLWTDERKAHYLKSLNLDKADEFSAEEVSLIRSIAEDLAEKGYPEGLEILAYSYYGGNCLYPCDWERSRDLLLQLLRADNPYESPTRKGLYANSLGYIYYYGRCNQGTPQYDLAFYYYTIGASKGYYQSVYKLADMFLYGKGTEKDEDSAENLVWQVYKETKRLFLKGKYDCEFADAALRMGTLCEGEPEQTNPIRAFRAYRFYLEADLAIGLRLEQVSLYGDEKVAKRIRAAVKRLKPVCEYENPQEMMRDNTEPALFYHLLAERKTALFTVKKDGKQIEITGKRVTVPAPVYDVDFGGRTSPKEEQPEKILAVLPEYGICRLADEVTYRIRKVRELKIAGEKDSFKANIMRMLMDDDGCRCEFWRDDEMVAYVDADYYVYVGEEEVK
ncbi:MAG: hypothetical protein LUE29_04290 [Lachnospiraceae bacterium]|nr:hypothetical protein [Lachnospiraceae bacterium]